MTTIESVKQDLQTMMEEWKNQDFIRKEGLFLIGCSTSEVVGEHIGTAGSKEVAAAIYEAMKKFQQETGVDLAFQCCEHLNRAIVLERKVQQRLQIPEVNAIPQPQAGGSMATHAYQQMEDPVLVESVQADYGMDIGETFIGMQLKPVVVPLRLQTKQLGNAHVTHAFTRPKLIGGERAVYRK